MPRHGPAAVPPVDAVAKSRPGRLRAPAQGTREGCPVSYLYQFPAAPIPGHGHVCRLAQCMAWRGMA
jgi:hypothetical protein